MKAILNKLYGNNKRSTSVKKIKVELVTIDDVMDNVVLATNQMKETLESAINNLNSAIDDLYYLSSIKSDSLEYRSRMDEIFDILEEYGYDPGQETYKVNDQLKALENLPDIDSLNADLNSIKSNCENMLNSLS